MPEETITTSPAGHPGEAGALVRLPESEVIDCRPWREGPWVRLELHAHEGVRFTYRMHPRTARELGFVVYQIGARAAKNTNP